MAVWLYEVEGLEAFTNIRQCGLPLDIALTIHATSDFDWTTIPPLALQPQLSSMTYLIERWANESGIQLG